MERPKVLVLGSGAKRRPGAVHADIRSNCAPDVVCDLGRTPWPFRDDAFDEIVAEHILEHLPDLPAALREVHRVGRPGARVRIVTPHFSSAQSWDDPTHRLHLSLKSFDYFHPGHPHHDGTLHLAVESKELRFSPSLWNLWGRFFYRLSPVLYERRFAFRWPARNLHVTLRVKKDAGP